MRFRVVHLLTLTAFIALLASCAVVKNGFWERFLPFACGFYVFCRIEPRPGSASDLSKSLLSFLIQLTRGAVIATLTAVIVTRLLGPPKANFYQFARMWPSLLVFALIGGALGTYWSRDAKKE